MAPAVCAHLAPVPPPSYHRTVATALHLDALTLVIRLHLLEMCRVAVQLAQQQCPPPPSPSSPPFEIAGAIAEAVGCCANMASYEDGVGVGKLVHCAL
jgi:hypothetical protein